MSCAAPNVDTVPFEVVSGDNSRHTLVYDSNNMAQRRSVDSSGYLFQPQAAYPTSPTGWAEADYSYSKPFQWKNLNVVALGQLRTPDGNLYSYSSTGETIKDPDGNTISITGAPNTSNSAWEAAMLGASTSVSITDSMARTITPPSAMTSDVSGCPTLNAQNQPLVGSRQWAVPGPNGTQSQYLLCYATVTVYRGFGFNDGYSAGNCSNNNLACLNNNDYFGARYYASSMGRWLSPDWEAGPQ